MGTEIELDKVLEAASSKTLGSNIDSFVKALESTDKVVQHLDKIMDFINRMERSPFVGAVVRDRLRQAGISMENLALTPTNGIIPKTHLHSTVMENINRMDEGQVNGMLLALREHDQKIISQKKELTDGAGKS